MKTKNKKNYIAGGAGFRAQAAAELLTYLGFFLLVFTAMTLLVIMQVGEDISQREYALSRSVAGQVADYAHLAIVAGPGFNATFQIPREINGKPYTLNFTNSGAIYVYVDPGKKSMRQYYFPLEVRAIELTSGCKSAGSGVYSYTDVSGDLHRSVGISATKGWLRLETYGDASGNITLKVC